MKKKRTLLYLFFTVFYFLTGNCQTGWFDQGSIWFYNTPYHEFESQHCTKSEIIGDTVIKGATNKILLYKDCSTNEIIATEYVHFSNDSIFYFNYYHDAYYLLYDFTAKEGDTVSVHNNKFKPTNGFQFNYSDSIENFQYVVSKVDSVLISGEWLKRQKTKPINQGDWFFFSAYDTAAYNVEKIGNLGYFFGRYGYITLSESIGMLRCYSDNIINYKSPNWNKECDVVSLIDNYRLPNINIYPNPSNSLLMVYPNPAKTLLIIESENINISQLSVVSVKGDTMIEETGDNITSINIEGLIPGYYFITCRNRENKFWVSKFIKI
ncbi:MAG: T9SS type A sorting domain-containing protein [Bacteroidales bacterium]